MDATGGFAALVVGEGEGQLVGEVMVAGHTLEVQLQGIFLRSVSVMWNLNGTMHQLQIHFSPENWHPFFNAWIPTHSQQFRILPTPHNTTCFSFFGGRGRAFKRE